MYQLIQRRYDLIVFGISLLALAVCLFAPLVLVAFYATSANLNSLTPTAEVTVGIAVLFRATARRLLRASFQNILRTTFGTVSRAFARTATRRVIRVLARTYFGAFFKQQAAGDDVDDSAAEKEARPSLFKSSVAIGLGFVGLSLSFWGVLYLAHTRGDPVPGEFGSLSLLTACLLAGLPIVIYGVITLVAAKMLGVQAKFATSFDGLLIQGYFTGAGSFLPMTTDITYYGHNLAKARLATVALFSLVCFHWLLYAIAQQTGSPEAGFASAMFVVYAFVYSFPISPLEGSDIWRVSKFWWLVVFAPILYSFLTWFPNELAGLL